MHILRRLVVLGKIRDGNRDTQRKCVWEKIMSSQWKKCIRLISTIFSSVSIVDEEINWLNIFLELQRYSITFNLFSTMVTVTVQRYITRLFYEIHLSLLQSVKNCLTHHTWRPLHLRWIFKQRLVLSDCLSSLSTFSITWFAFLKRRKGKKKLSASK